MSSIQWSHGLRLQRSCNKCHSAVQFRTFFGHFYNISDFSSQCQDDVSGAGLSPRQDGGVHRQHGEPSGGDDGGLLQREKEN